MKKGVKYIQAAAYNGKRTVYNSLQESKFDRNLTFPQLFQPIEKQKCKLLYTNIHMCNIRSSWFYTPFLQVPPVPQGSPSCFMYDMNEQSVPTLVDNKEVTETTTEENNETDDSDNDLLLRIIFKKWQ